jgi:GAF domain-containing protein
MRCRGPECAPAARAVPAGPFGARLPGVLPGRIMDAIGEQLAGSLEIDARLQHVAEMLVPQFAGHCFIDLFQGDALIRRVQRHAGGWTPQPGTWAQVGEQFRYPQGHFCQRAMARLDTIIVTSLPGDRGEDYPPPSAQSMATAREVGITLVLAAPLYARGVLLGVMSLALSDQTDRTERHYCAADRYLIGAIVSQVAVAIDRAITVRGRPPDRAGPSSIAPAASWP